MTVRTIDQESFEREVLESKTPVVVDFYGGLCPPSVLMEPVFKLVARRWSDVAEFVRLNVDHDGGLSDKYAVRSIPQFILFIDGKPASRAVGLIQGLLLEKELCLRQLRETTT